MLASTEEARTFESLKADLMRTSPGQFAAVCGSKLLGVFTSVDDALQAASDAFDADTLPAGAPILITEIAEKVSLRVMATPQQRIRSAPAQVRLRELI
jgi:hypothetical protein